VRVTTTEASGGKTAARLRELERLRIDGVITDDEYTARRAAIIAEL
jgi:putative oligomerization/nucleic acid binding protein